MSIKNRGYTRATMLVPTSTCNQKSVGEIGFHQTCLSILTFFLKLPWESKQGCMQRGVNLVVTYISAFWTDYMKCARAASSGLSVNIQKGHLLSWNMLT